MSGYIKGMEMPKSCLTCPCTDTEYGECVLDPEKRCPEDYSKRADWCPLVSVPPHGRLIDADALMKKGMPLSFSMQKWVQEVDIACAPTIIPASKEECA